MQLASVAERGGGNVAYCSEEQEDADQVQRHALHLNISLACPRCQERGVSSEANVRCQGGRAECSTLKPSILVPFKACQGKKCRPSRGKMVDPGIFALAGRNSKYQYGDQTVRIYIYPRYPPQRYNRRMHTYIYVQIHMWRRTSTRWE